MCNTQPYKTTGPKQTQQRVEVKPNLELFKQLTDHSISGLAQVLLLSEQKYVVDSTEKNLNSAVLDYIAVTHVH